MTQLEQTPTGGVEKILSLCWKDRNLHPINQLEQQIDLPVHTFIVAITARAAFIQSLFSSVNNTNKRTHLASRK
jgi:hypothetical protein